MYKVKEVRRKEERKGAVAGRVNKKGRGYKFNKRKEGRRRGQEQGREETREERK